MFTTSLMNGIFLTRDGDGIITVCCNFVAGVLQVCCGCVAGLLRVCCSFVAGLLPVLTVLRVCCNSVAGLLPLCCQSDVTALYLLSLTTTLLIPNAFPHRLFPRGSSNKFWRQVKHQFFKVFYPHNICNESRTGATI